MDVRVSGVRKEFDRFPALHDVSLDINSGELIALLGPSGSGKTTLLRLIAGLETPTEGKVFFGDEDASLKSVQERNVGFVFQHYALFRHMTVIDNVGFGLKVRPSASRPSNEEIRRRSSELLDFVQLGGLEKRYPAQLSGGQRQRVALARALVNKPKVLLLDEPLGALDLKLREQMQEELKTLQKSLGITFVFVTHDQGEALSMADRIAVFNEGRIQQLGTPEDVYKRPKTRFVADFVGSSNILQPEFVTQLGAGRQLASLRPEAIELTGKKDGQLSLSGIVLSRSFLGASNRITVDVSGTKLHVTSPAASPVPEEGSKVTLSFAPADLHLMEAV